MGEEVTLLLSERFINYLTRYVNVILLTGKGMPGQTEKK